MRKPIKILAAFVVAIGLIGGVAWQKSKKAPDESDYEIVIASRQDLSEEVSVVGAVVPALKAELGLEKSGIIQEVHVKAGDRVSAGQPLLTLRNETEKIQLQEAGNRVEIARRQREETEARLKTEEIRLTELKKGIRPEEIRLSATLVRNAKLALEDAKKNLREVENKGATDLNNTYRDIPDLVLSAYQKAEESLHKHTELFFENANTSDPRLKFNVAFGAQIPTDLEQLRIEANEALRELEKAISPLPQDPAKLPPLLKKTIDHLTIFRRYLEKTNEAVNKTIQLAPATLSDYQNRVSVARESIQNSLTALNNQTQTITLQKTINGNARLTAETAVHNAESNVAKAEDELALKKAGTTPEAVAAEEAIINEIKALLSTQKARIEQAEINQRLYQQEFEKTILKAPFAGEITRVDVKPGEALSFSGVGTTRLTGVITLISLGPPEIEAYIPEVDIAKIETNDVASVTLDAYGPEDIFKARITSVDPAETIKEGIATYKITLVFQEKDSRIRPGMTANIDLITDQKTQVVAIPQRALIMDNGQKKVRILKSVDSKITVEERNVVTGLKSSDGKIEIVEGLSEGEKVVLFIKES